jgi:sec-independent protein translocase protein TatA
MVSTQTLLLVGAIVVVIFGAAKLPQLGKGVGEAIKNFKKAVSEPAEIDVTPKKDDEKKEVKEEKK